MNTYIFNAFIIIVIFILIKIGVILTMLNIRNNKDDENISVLYEKHVNCIANWKKTTYNNICITNDYKASTTDTGSCADFTVSTYTIEQEPVGDGVKCLYSPSQLNTIGEGTQVCQTPTTVATCNPLPTITGSGKAVENVQTIHTNFTNSPVPQCI